MFAVEIGQVAEWLGRGLQNLLQRFESALDLNTAFKPHSRKGNGVFAFWGWGYKYRRFNIQQLYGTLSRESVKVAST